MQDFILLVFFMGSLILLAWPLSRLVARVFTTEPQGVFVATRGIENTLFKLLGIQNQKPMNAKDWVISLLVFSIIEILVLFLILIFQNYLPLNPEHFVGLSWDLAINTSISFITNTNWQNYSGETTLSQFSQMAGLTVQNFLSAACGLAVCAALIRGLTGKETKNLGNFWVDLVRINIYILLPLAFIFAIILLSQGVIQNFSPNLTVHTLAGGTQTLPQGPVASQEAIKIIGTNGGGYFNANSAHPFENPTSFTNFLQMIAMFLISASLVLAFGRIIKDRRQSRTIFIVMTVFFILAFIGLLLVEQGNMEGKEVRFGVTGSALFTTITTSTSTGAINSQLDSYTPLGGLVPFILLSLQEIVFGGVGSGLSGMLTMVLLTVFVGGLMVGRTPEYLGKKIEPKDMKMIVIAILVTPIIILAGTATAVLLPDTAKSLNNPVPQGFSEILYAFASAGNNNGSAFAGLNGNTPFFNLALGLTMFLGRFGVMVPLLFLAGNLGQKKLMASSLGTMPTYGGTFGILLTFFILITAALNFIPAFALGPIAQAF